MANVRTYVRTYVLTYVRTQRAYYTLREKTKSVASARYRAASRTYVHRGRCTVGVGFRELDMAAGGMKLKRNKSF